MATIGRLEWMHVFIDVPPATAAQTRSFWSQALGWPAGDAWEQHPEFTSLLPPEGDPYVHVQEVDDDSRVHLDVVVDDLDQGRDRVVDLGAETGMRTARWQVMRSPGGLPFCLCLDPDAGVRPPGTRHADGHRSRLAQLCIDIPADAFDRERAFWHTVTGWTTAPPGRPEFWDLVGPPNAPLRLLLQRLGPDDTGTTVRAHIDLGSDDRDAEVERLTALGGRYIERYAGWTVLVDPAGLPFCVTDKSPR